MKYLIILTVTILFSLKAESQSNKHSNSKTDTSKVSNLEASFVAGLYSRNQSLRDSCAKEIRSLLKQQKNVIKPGNIVEHKRSYWEAKKAELEFECDMEKIKSTFNFEINNGVFISGGGRSSYSRRLDNTFTLSFSSLDKEVEHSNEYRFKSLKITESCRMIFLEPDSMYNGVWRLYDTNGNLYNETNYINGKRNGFSNHYFGTGELKAVTHYEENRIRETLTYYKNGMLKSRRKQINAERDTEVSIYDEEGRLVSTDVEKKRVRFK